MHWCFYLESEGFVFDAAKEIVLTFEATRWVGKLSNRDC
jgi:hypothetical protein